LFATGPTVAHRHHARLPARPDRTGPRPARMSGHPSDGAHGRDGERAWELDRGDRRHSVHETRAGRITMPSASAPAAAGKPRGDPSGPAGWRRRGVKPHGATRTRSDAGRRQGPGPDNRPPAHGGRVASFARTGARCLSGFGAAQPDVSGRMFVRAAATRRSRGPSTSRQAAILATLRRFGSVRFALAGARICR
jgi:hypothetical protein